jgi:hypothetical protein
MVSLNTAAATECPTDAGCLWGEAAVLGVAVKGHRSHNTRNCNAVRTARDANSSVSNTPYVH